MKIEGRTPGGPTGGALVLFPGALGDAVCLEPTIEWLARQGPVSVRMRGAAAEVAKLFRVPPRVDSLDRPECGQLFAPLEHPVRCPSWLESFDRVVSFTGEASVEAAARLHAAGAAVHPFPARTGRQHAADEMLRAVAGEGAARALPQLVLPVSEHRAPGRLVLHPGSGGAAKRAPRRLFVEVAHRWQESGTGRESRVVLGPAEEHEFDWWDSSGISTARPGDVASLARELGQAGVYLGNDSGPSHVAAALETPSLVLFRASSPKRFGPRGTSVRWLGSDARDVGDADFVWAALQALVP